jgi:hypothetical protein
MSNLIITGIPYSYWCEIVLEQVGAGAQKHPRHAELSSLCEQICRDHHQAEDELGWRSFVPDAAHAEQAEQLMRQGSGAGTTYWADSNAALNLDFWREADPDNFFILFFSSPEWMLGNFIDSALFHRIEADRVVEAWIDRARNFLQFALNHRKQSLLINVESLGADPASFATIIESHFGLSVPAKPQQELCYPRQSTVTRYVASSLLLTESRVSDLYDNLRSASTAVHDQDHDIDNLHDRHDLLLDTFLNEVRGLRDQSERLAELEAEFSLKQQQVTKLLDELEYYYTMSKKQAGMFTSYLESEALLRVARWARVIQ